VFLSYDIKGIQRFIFSVPKLKCIIGASGIIAQFDERAEELATQFGAELIFSGGGRGVFECLRQEPVSQLANALVASAHEVGLDMRIGSAESLSEAVQGADQLYPFCPNGLEGEPCILSGLWPVSNQREINVKRGVHPLIWRRIVEARRDELGKTILKRLEKDERIPEVLKPFDLEFFKNVSPYIASEYIDEDEEAKRQDEAEARTGQAAIGGRNRWAIIAMDGNDMGRQFEAYRKLSDRNGWSEADQRDWIRAMSSALKECTWQASVDAIHKVLELWSNDGLERGYGPEFEPWRVKDDNGMCTNRMILPMRPLVLGGDDVTLLCHPSFAMEFVRYMSKRFTEISKQLAKDHQAKLKAPLWPATNGQLTISAGVLYSKVSFPLHMAIPYAESLLASAKGAFRDPESLEATPSAVDWETITDSLVDSPTARRNREMRFIDEELSQDGKSVTVLLTQRPYAMEPTPNHADLPTLLMLMDQIKEKRVPRSIQATILPALQKPWSERIAFFASIAKRQAVLKEMLWEGGETLGKQWTPTKPNSHLRSTGVPDALSLLEEDHRMASSR
jgi:hypothetical protein